MCLLTYRGFHCIYPFYYCSWRIYHVALLFNLCDSLDSLVLFDSRLSDGDKNLQAYLRSLSAHQFSLLSFFLM